MFLGKDQRTYYECMLDLMDSQNSERIPADILHTDFQYIRADIDRHRHRFVPDKLHSIHMGSECTALTVRKLGFVEQCIE